MNPSHPSSANKIKKEAAAPFEFSSELQLTPTFMKGRSPLLQAVAQEDGFLIASPAAMSMAGIPNSPNVTKVKLTMGDKENSLTFFSNSPADELSSLISKCNLSWAFRCSIRFLLIKEEKKVKGKSLKGRLKLTILVPSQKIYDNLKFNFNLIDA